MKDDKFGTKKYFAGFFAILVIFFPFSNFSPQLKNHVINKKNKKKY